MALPVGGQLSGAALCGDFLQQRSSDMLSRQCLEELRSDWLPNITDPGLDRLIEARQKTMVATYRQALGRYSDLGDRVRALARLRTREGYMAEFEKQKDGSFLLIENHCPICAAAKTCQGFCRSEIEQFQAALGAGVVVTRHEHLLSEGRRCVYRIARVAAPTRSRRKRGQDDPPAADL